MGSIDDSACATQRNNFTGKESLESSELNIIETEDLDYVQKTRNLDMGGISTLDPSDPVVMRKWLQNCYMKLPKEPKAKRIREPVTIFKKNVPIPYEGDSRFSIRIYDPRPEHLSDGPLRPVLIMLHGGGWIHGFPEVDDETSEFFASELRAVVISVDYRLAPEHPFPLPLDDCYEALNWTIVNAPAYRIDVKRIALWGASAGGNLAAGVALRDVTENNVPRIRHVNLVVPATCHADVYPPVLRGQDASPQKFGDPKNTEAHRDGLRKIWNMYAGADFAHPYASVLLAEIPENHPPVHVVVAACDALRDEGIAYALRLRDRGIDTQLEIIPGIPHGVGLSPDTYAAKQFLVNQVRALDYALNMGY